MKADTIYYNGQIVTMNESSDWAQAVAVRGNKILAVGSVEQLLADKADDTTLVDLQGKMMLPGFIDSHCHPVFAMFFLGGLVIDFDETLDEVLAHIKEYIDANPNEQRYYAFGYREGLFGAEGPSKELLDNICADKAILVQSSGGHEAWCNSCCLECAGVDASTPDPVPGLQYFHRDENNNPTGHIVENAPINYIYKKAGFLANMKIEETLERFSKGYAELGITSLVDCGYPEDIFGKEMIMETMQRMLKEGRLTQRCFSSACFLEEPKDFDRDMEALLDKCVVDRDSCTTDLFHSDFVKILDDGTFESRNAAMYAPYLLDNLQVDPMLKQEDLISFALLVAKKGLDLHIHAIGDQAVHDVLMAAKAVREAGFKDMRITTAHTELVRPEDVPLFAKYNVTANTSSVWHYGEPERVLDLGEWGDQVFRMMAIRRCGGRITQSSDHPASEYGNNPLSGVEVAYTRQILGTTDTPVLGNPDQSMPIMDTLRGYTIDAAYQVHMEEKLGSIEPGKYADFVVLEESPYNVEPHHIHEIDVAMTIMDGKVVYQKGN